MLLCLDGWGVWRGVRDERVMVLMSWVRNWIEGLTSGADVHSGFC